MLTTMPSELPRTQAIDTHRLRVLGLVKGTLLLGLTLAACNLDRVRSFRAKHGLDDNGMIVEPARRPRARRRTGTWTDVIEAGPGPPRT